MLTKIRYGNTNTVLLQGDKGSILIDTDYAGTMPAFYKTCKRTYEPESQTALSLSEIWSRLSTSKRMRITSGLRQIGMRC